METKYLCPNQCKSLKHVHLTDRKGRMPYQQTSIH